MDFYAPMISSDIAEHGFNESSLTIQTIFLLVLVAICWVLQKYVQETLVASLYSSFLTSKRKLKR